MVDALVLGTSVERRVGSNPSSPTIRCHPLFPDLIFIRVVLGGELAVPCYLQTALAGSMLVLGYYRIDIDN